MPSFYETLVPWLITLALFLYYQPSEEEENRVIWYAIITSIVIFVPWKYFLVPKEVVLLNYICKSVISVCLALVLGQISWLTLNIMFEIRDEGSDHESRQEDDR